LVAINPDGTEKWERALPRGHGIGWYTLRAAPAILADGSILVAGQFFEPRCKANRDLDS
jgi:hypothetical protein